MLAEDAADGSANQLAGDGVGAFELAFVFQFELAGDGRKSGVNIGDARDRIFFADTGGALLGIANDAFQRGDWEALAYSRTAVDALVFAGLEGDFLDDFSQVAGDVDFASGIPSDPCFLLSDGHAFFEGRWIMGANFRADAVFQGRNNFSAGGVVFRVRGKDEKHVERETQRVAFNLDVAFLHDVEEADLNFSGEVGKLVDGEDAAIGAGQQAVVNGEFVGEVAATAGGANGIDVADNVGHGDVGSGELFDEALVAGHPCNGCVVALIGDFLAASAADRAQRVVVDLAAGDDRNFDVQQLHKTAQDAALGLPAQTQEDEIMTRKERVDDLRHNGIFVAVDAWKKGLAFFDGAQ